MASQGTCTQKAACESPRLASARQRRARARCASAGSSSSAAAVVGIVLVDHGSRKAESNDMLLELVEAFKRHSGRSIVHAAHMELAQPTVADAFAACVADGAELVVISPYFLSPGRHWQEDLPALAAAAASAHAGVRFLVAAPLATHPLVSQVLESRIQHCLAHVAGAAPACDVCTSAGIECALKSTPRAS